MLFLINTHVGILHCMVYITICYEGIFYKYLVLVICTAKSKESNEAEYLSKYLHVIYK